MSEFTKEHYVTLGDGEQYALHFDMVAVCAFEEASGEAITGLGEGSVKMTTLVHLLAAGLRHHHPDVAKPVHLLKGVKRGKRRTPPLLTLKNMDEVLPPLLEAINDAMPQESDEDPEAPENNEGND